MERSIDPASRPRFTDPASVKLRPIDSPALLELVAGWLSERANNQWLDFGDAAQVLSPAWLKIMTQRESHLLRVFSPADQDTPIGVIALSDIHRKFKTARIWIVVGDKSFRARGYGTAAASAMLAIAFRDLGLVAVNTWFADGNPSVRIVERLHFTFIGRQRRCHYIDGQPRDRLWYDILSTDYEAV
jgi:RimJ/RimL family protein N-acetyltransferase